MKPFLLDFAVAFALGSALAACSAPAPVLPTALPTAVPTEPLVAPSATPMPTATVSLAPPTIPFYPTLTPKPTTPTPTPTPTLQILPTPAGVIFKFDDGVPQDQRDTLIQGLAMARAYLGNSRPLTVVAYADLNAQMEELARLEGQSRENLASQQKGLQDNRAMMINSSLMAFPMSKTWMARPQLTRLTTAVHEYFHVVQAYLANVADINSYAMPTWIIEGTADFAMYRILSKYGYYNLKAIHQDTVQFTRGIVSSLKSMETQKSAIREWDNSPYYFGYLADEMLGDMAGDDAILRKFWENYPKYPGWPLAFQATFGISSDDFYKRFEDERRSNYPPLCGIQDSDYAAPGPTDPLSLKLIRQDSPGAVTFSTFPSSYNPPAPVAYTFCISGLNFATLWDTATTRQYPTGFGGAISCGGNCIIIYMQQKTDPGQFTFAVEAKDKRRAEIQFQHSIPPAAPPAPPPAPTPKP